MVVFWLWLAVFGEPRRINFQPPKLAGVGPRDDVVDAQARVPVADRQPENIAAANEIAHNLGVKVESPQYAPQERVQCVRVDRKVALDVLG